jgi:hypothetical protein
MRIRKTHLLIIATAVVLTAVLAAVVVAQGERATTQDLSAAASEDISSFSVPGGLSVWMQPDEKTLQPNGDQSGDGVVYARLGAASEATSTSILGPGIGAQLLRGGAEPLVMVERYDGTCHVFAYQADSGQWQEMQAFSEEPDALCASGDALDYVAIEDSRQVVSQNPSDASTAQTYVAPRMDGYSDDIGPISLPVNYDSTKAIVTSLVPLSGKVLAFSTNVQACQLTDFPSGYTTTLDGARTVIASCAGRDGYIYALGTGPKRGDSLRLLRIDPTSLQTTRVWDTQWASNANGRPRLNRAQLLPTEDGVALWLVESTQTPETVAPMHLWMLSGDTLQDDSSSLPPRVGIDAACGSGGTLLLYGGYAKEGVSRFTLSTGNVSSVPELGAPDGSWLLIAAE